MQPTDLAPAPAPPVRPAAGVRPRRGYRVAVAAIAFVAATFGVAVAPAGAAPDEDGDAIWRLRVRLYTGDVSYAGTDDDVRVYLNGTSATWIDSPADDFERNTVRSYDLPLTGVDHFEDIERLKIAKTGDDGLCLSRVDLYVNNRVVFDRYVSSTSSCRWLDGDLAHRSVSWTGSQLRADEEWPRYTQPEPSLVYSPTELRQRMEGTIGHRIRDNALYWGHLYGEAVEMWGTSDGTALHVDLDLAADVFGPDPEVDIDFDLQFSCSGDEFVIESRNVRISADSDRIWEVITFGAINLIDNQVANDVADGFGSIREALGSSLDACPQVLVWPDGTVIIVGVA